MTAITESNTYPAVVNRYDLTDPVLGGVSGESNDPIIALANRTRFMYNYMAGYVAIAAVSASATIGASYLRKLITISAAGNIVLTLDAVSTFLPGQALHFKCANAGVKCVSIVAGDTITDGNGTRKIWLYNGESVTLVAGTGSWMVMNLVGNHDMVGNDSMVRKQPRNTIIANGNTPENSGTLLNRADYARLWDAVGDTAISDGLWLSDAVSYRSFFSIGNGTTTFRVPDMRSMMLRGLDLGRGLSFTRVGSDAGAYESDVIKSHSHNTNRPRTDAVGSQYEGNQIRNGGDRGLYVGDTVAVTTTGGPENLVKNIGLTPVIYF